MTNTLWEMPLPDKPPPGPICRECGMDHGLLHDPMAALIKCLGQAVERIKSDRHELVPATRINHPGSKDGWFRAFCTCGKSATEAYPGRAERRIRDHIRDKS